MSTIQLRLPGCPYLLNNMLFNSRTGSSRGTVFKSCPSLPIPCHSHPMPNVLFCFYNVYLLNIRYNIRKKCFFLNPKPYDESKVKAWHGEWPDIQNLAYSIETGVASCQFRLSIHMLGQTKMSLPEQGTCGFGGF